MNNSYGQEMNGVATLSDNLLTISSAFYNCVIKLDRMQFVTVLRQSFENRPDPLVCLGLIEQNPTGYDKRYLPLSFSGAQFICEHISVNYGIKLKFDKLLRYKGNGEKLIGRTRSLPNFKILETYKRDADNGFEVLSDPPIFIRWDTAEQILRDKYPTHLERETPLRFLFPVRIGNLEFDNSLVLSNDDWSCNLTLPHQGIKCFEVLKEALKTYFKITKIERQEALFPFTFGVARNRFLSASSLLFILRYNASSSSGLFHDPDTTEFTVRIVRARSKKEQQEEERNSRHTDEYRREFGY